MKAPTIAVLTVLGLAPVASAQTGIAPDSLDLQSAEAARPSQATADAATSASPSSPSGATTAPTPPYRLPAPPEPRADYPRESRPSAHAREDTRRAADLPPVAKTDSFMLIQRRGLLLHFGGGLSTFYVARVANAQATYPGFQGVSWDINSFLGGAVAPGVALGFEFGIDFMWKSEDVQIVSGGSGKPLFGTVGGRFHLVSERPPRTQLEQLLVRGLLER
jgi:hypothetical protein